MSINIRAAVFGNLNQTKRIRSGRPDGEIERIMGTVKNIAILVWALKSGGAERIAGLLSVNLSRQYNVYLFVWDTSDMVYEYGGTLVDVSGKDMESIEKNIREKKSELKIDCSISFLTGANDLNIRLRVNDKIIVSERCAHSPNIFFNACMNSGLWNNYRSADAIVAASHGISYDLENNIGIENVPIKVIYNYVDKQGIIEKARNDLDEEIKSFVGNSKVILNVGRLDEQKNQSELIVQFAKLLKIRKDLKLIILGSGPLKESLQNQIDELNIQEYAKIIPFYSNPFPFYRVADIYASTSDFEGLSNVLMEAMCLRVPIVATDCLAGTRELIDSEYDYCNHTEGYVRCKRGILVEVSDREKNGETDNFAKALNELLSDSIYYKEIQENQKVFMDAYDNERITSEWVEIIEKTKQRNVSIPKKLTIGDLRIRHKVIIYGAGAMGKRVLSLIKKTDHEIISFAVTEKGTQKDFIEGIPVKDIEELVEYGPEVTVFLALNPQFYEEIIKNLKKLGFDDTVMSHFFES